MSTKVLGILVVILLLSTGCLEIFNSPEESTNPTKNIENLSNTDNLQTNNLQKEPLCKEVTYFENVPKEVTVPYTETVCVDVSYQEPYQDQECHNEIMSYSLSSLQKDSYFNFDEGCGIKAFLNVTNVETQNSGNFIVNFEFVTAEGKSTKKSVEKYVNASSTALFETTYDKTCLESDPTIKATVQIPEKQVCVTVTKYATKIKQECHEETKYKTEIVYEPVEKTKTICEGEEFCKELNCDDKKECTIDLCNEKGCNNIPKEDGTLCENGLCEKGNCVKTEQQQKCSYENCESKSKTECLGTTKISTDYYCENNACIPNVIQKNNSVDCGYKEIIQPSTLDKLKSIFNNFPEFKQLRNESSIDVFVWNDDSYLITKKENTIEVKQSNKSGDLSLVVPEEVPDILKESQNKCQTLYTLIANGLISNVEANANSMDLLYNNFCSLKNCIPSNKVPEIGNCI